jgi:hypothetical protein
MREPPLTYIIGCTTKTGTGGVESYFYLYLYLRCKSESANLYSLFPEATERQSLCEHSRPTNSFVVFH